MLLSNYHSASHEMSDVFIVSTSDFLPWFTISWSAGIESDSKYVEWIHWFGDMFAQGIFVQQGMFTTPSVICQCLSTTVCWACTNTPTEITLLVPSLVGRDTFKFLLFFSINTRKQKFLTSLYVEFSGLNSAASKLYSVYLSIYLSIYHCRRMYTLIT